MLYFIHDTTGNLVDVTEKHDHSRKDVTAVSRWEFKEMADAEKMAAAATALKGEVYLPVDKGNSTFPRYDVILAPKIGDKVSYSFNGDTYPDGEIVHITEGTYSRIKTSTGKWYHRRKQSGNWSNASWSLIPGHKTERNPHF